jgi:hypothetical protein
MNMGEVYILSRVFRSDDFNTNHWFQVSRLGPICWDLVQPQQKQLVYPADDFKQSILPEFLGVADDF